MSKVIQVEWLTATNGTIGIVVIDNGFKKKAYIKQVAGIDEKQDIKDVAENGAKLHRSTLTQIINHLKTH